MIFILNMAFYVFSTIQYQNEIDRQYDALYTMSAHLATEENYDTLEIYLEHYTHTNQVLILFTDMDQQIIFTNDIDSILKNKQIVYYNEVPVGYMAVSFESSRLNSEITYGFIGLNLISISLFLIGMFILFNYLNKESNRIDTDLNNIENPEETINYIEMDHLRKKLQTSNAQKLKQKSIYEAHIKSLAHDIKTPLSVIQIYTESLANKKLDFNDEILADLHEEAKKIERIIPKFIEANYSELPYQQDISLYIEDYVKRYHEIFETKNIEMKTELGTMLVMISDTDLERLIEHLTFNAFYYSKPKTKVVIKTISQLGQLIIRDEGIGMTAQTIENILKGPFRSEEAKALNEKGSGIGYQIIMEMMNRLNAHINIYSEVGKGTEVVITF